jgi:hypothetical protein
LSWIHGGIERKCPGHLLDDVIQFELDPWWN